MEDSPPLVSGEKSIDSPSFHNSDFAFPKLISGTNLEPCPQLKNLMI